MTDHVWLASGSPRRMDLLTRVGLAVRRNPPEVPEVRAASESPIAYATRLAISKAATGPADLVVVAADTVVHMANQVYEKPVDRRDGARILGSLSGRWHQVTTGVCVRLGPAQRAFHVTTEVRFRKLQPEEIDAYLATGEADDKAGAYGIQGLGGALVAEVRGSWTNVMGLPLEETLAAIERVKT